MASLPLNHRQPSGPASVAGAGLRFHIAQPADVAALHAWYCACSAWPFFTEIAGPTPMLTRSQFREYCSIDAQLMVGMEGGRLCAFILLTYIQNGIHVANLDFRWRDGYPDAHSAQATVFTSALRLLCARAGVTKTHLLSLPMEADRLRFAHGLDFVQEGVLAQHFFHHGRRHDLRCLGRSDEDGDARG